MGHYLFAKNKINMVAQRVYQRTWLAGAGILAGKILRKFCAEWKQRRSDGWSRKAAIIILILKFFLKSHDFDQNRDAFKPYSYKL